MTNNAATKNESNVERHPRYIEEEGNMQYNMQRISPVYLKYNVVCTQEK